MGAETIRERVTYRTERYNLARAAEIVGVSKAELVSLAKKGEIPRAAQFGPRTWSFEIMAFRKWAREFRPQPKPPVYKRTYTGSRVYFIQAGDFVKIGFSLNVSKRIKSIQSGSPVPIRLLFTVSGGPRVERIMHKRFASQRELNEWFRIEGELEAFIEENRRG